jgi:MSHA biogenesis protein MshQ
LGGGTTPVLDLSGLPATTADPTISAFISGVGTLTFSSGLAFLRSTTTPSALFNADIALALNVVDTDGVAFGANPASFGVASAGNGIAFSNGKQMRFGRLRMQNAAGSTLLDLPLSIEAQYYNGTAFTRNAVDNCTSFAATAVGLNNYTANLAACETAIQTPAGNITFSGGLAQNVVMRKPGSTNAGSVDLTANLGAATVVPNTCTAVGAGAITSGPTSAANLPYLQGDWGGGALTGNPVSRATFGIYKNAGEFIYFRENY